MKGGTLLAITRPAVFGQVYRTRKKEKQKQKNILFYKQKLNKIPNLSKRPKIKVLCPYVPVHVAVEIN
jgi:hypothetical protein